MAQITEYNPLMGVPGFVSDAVSVWSGEVGLPGGAEHAIGGQIRGVDEKVRGAGWHVLGSHLVKGKLAAWNYDGNAAKAVGVDDAIVHDLAEDSDHAVLCIHISVASAVLYADAYISGCEVSGPAYDSITCLYVSTAC